MSEKLEALINLNSNNASHKREIKLLTRNSPMENKITEEKMNYFKHYIEELENFSRQVENHERIDPDMFQKLEKINKNLFTKLIEIEQKHSSNGLKDIQNNFRSETDFIFEKSWLMTRARKWFKGYPGDFETIEAVYKGSPSSLKGIGHYLDTYFLTRHLALGVRARKDKLREILMEELCTRRRSQKILNIACGSCRELYEMLDTVNDNEPSIICTDSDKDALIFAHNLLFSRKIKKMPQFVVHNALRLVNNESNEKILGKKDIIYSAGLFDYLKDETIIKIFNALFHLLNNGGILIAPFKDSRFYNRLEYHWLVDWSAFFQRTPDETISLFQNIGTDKVSILESSSPAIKFFVVRKN